MTTADREDRIDAMLAREAIRDLPIRYCHYVRTRDLPAMLDLFAREGAVEMPAGIATSSPEGGLFQGRERLWEMFSAGYSRSYPLPFVHNHVVDLTGPDTARGCVSAEIRRIDQGLRTVQVVIYEDDYLREDGRWKFRRRRMESMPIRVEPRVC